MERILIRPARASDVADLAQNWIEVAQHYVELTRRPFGFHRPMGWSSSSRGRSSGHGQKTRCGSWPRWRARLSGMSAHTWSAVCAMLDTYAVSPLSVPFYERGMGYRRRSIVFEKRLD